MSAAHEVVISQHALEPLADDLRREQLGEAGRHRFEQRLLAGEMHIGVDCKSRCRQQAAFRDDIIAIEPKPAGQAEPALDAALILAIAVVIDQPASPIASQVRIAATRDQVGVLDGDHRLIVVAVERPGLDLTLGAPTAMQKMMERMQAVVAAAPDVPQSRLKFVFGQRTRHSATSSPSSAISQPLLITCACSGDPSTRMGLVLLMWI